MKYLRNSAKICGLKRIKYQSNPSSLKLRCAKNKAKKMQNNAKYSKKSQSGYDFIYAATRNRPEITENLGLIEKTKPISGGGRSVSENELVSR